jgi:FkbM family methyltransferase
MPTRDVGIGAPLYTHRQYEYDASLRALRFLREKGFLASTDIAMLDIGANIGVIGIGLLLAGEVARVLAIEPAPTNFPLLCKNAEQNALSNRMLCLQLAAGEEAATLCMELSPDNRGDHRIRVRPAPGAQECKNESTRETIEVPSLSLPQVLERPEVRARNLSSPDLIWIDVQGYEGYVFRGAASLLRKPLPTVSEIWPYGILRAGMELEEFTRIVQSIWTDYWIERRERLIRYPTTMFMHYLDELGSDGYFENVIFT